jgi:hypothetical protein
MLSFIGALAIALSNIVVKLAAWSLSAGVTVIAFHQFAGASNGRPWPFYGRVAAVWLLLLSYQGVLHDLEVTPSSGSSLRSRPLLCAVGCSTPW